jgi:hypothetical protein
MINRLISFSVNDILRVILSERALIIPGIKPIKTHTPRLRTFLKGIKCIVCAIKGNLFAVEQVKKEQPDNIYHLNLYYVDELTGKEVLMTSDHSHPKSKGGKGHLFNRVPMCTNCNRQKGDKVIKNAKTKKLNPKREILVKGISGKG